jgi:GNAT superfamily N-acetyltransferase
VVDIRLFAADRASAQELEDYYQVVTASAADWSDEPPENCDVVVERLRNPSTVFGPATFWAACLYGRLVGFVRVSFPDRENADLVVVRCTVHPDFRRRGIGTDLLRFLLPEFRSRGRSSIEGWNIPQNGVGDRWALGLGFRQTNVRVVQRLMLREADPALWEMPAPTGYRAVSWVGSAPEELVASLALAQNAIHDAPRGDAEFQFPRWTAQRVREDERQLSEHGIERRVVAVVHEVDGEVVGFSEVDLRGAQRDTAIVNNTAVLAAHRGHGLGRYLKARSAQWLRSDLPALGMVLTSTAVSNAHMIRVNRQVGYVTTRTTLVCTAELSALETRLSP